MCGKMGAWQDSGVPGEPELQCGCATDLCLSPPLWRGRGMGLAPSPAQHPSGFDLQCCPGDRGDIGPLFPFHHRLRRNEKICFIKSSGKRVLMAGLGNPRNNKRSGTSRQRGWSEVLKQGGCSGGSKQRECSGASEGLVEQGLLHGSFDHLQPLLLDVFTDKVKVIVLVIKIKQVWRREWREAGWG